MTDPITVLGNLTSGPGELNQQTHYDGCWRDPAHHGCAVAEIERLEGVMEKQGIRGVQLANALVTAESVLATARAEALEEAAMECGKYHTPEGCGSGIRALKDRRP